MQLKTTNKINFFDLDDFIKKIWKKKYHNTNLSYYNYLINQNYSKNNNENILVGYEKERIVCFLCNINQFLSNYRVGSLINLYSLKDKNYSLLSAKLLKICMTNYDILFNSAPRKIFSDKLSKNNKWFSVNNYYSKISLNKDINFKNFNLEIKLNLIKIQPEHIKFINSLNELMYFDKSVNYYQWRVGGLNIFCKKNIFFIEYKINNQIRALFLVELKKNYAILHEYYSSLDDLEISLIYLIKFIKQKYLIDEINLFLHKSMFEIFKELKIVIINEKKHFFFLRDSNDSFKNMIIDKFLVFPTDSDEFLYL